jgi:uncharacterized protein (TIGR02271 family)
MMSIFGGIFGDEDDEVIKETTKKTTDDPTTLQLRKEELDISKSRVQKGEVELGKEIIEEQKTVDVPIEHEEVVIERRSLDNETSASPITDEETIRIPVSEEKVDVNKRTVVTGEISAHKRVVEDTEHVTETLKREEAKINRTGDPNVVDSSTDKDLY